MPDIYAVYKGDDLLAIGTAEECAELLKVKARTIAWYATPSYKRRLEQQKWTRNARISIKLEDE